MRMIKFTMVGSGVNSNSLQQIKDALIQRLADHGVSVRRATAGSENISLYGSEDDSIYTRRTNRIPIDPESDRAISLGRPYLETKKLTRTQADALLSELRYLKNLGLTEFRVEVQLNNGTSFELTDFSVPVSGMFSAQAVSQ